MYTHWIFGQWRDFRLEYAQTKEQERDGRVREFKIPVTAPDCAKAEFVGYRRALSAFGDTARITSVVKMEPCAHISTFTKVRTRALHTCEHCGEYLHG